MDPRAYLLCTLLVACTAPPPEPARTIETKPVPEDTQEPLAVAPSQGLLASAPPPAPVWWCTCYARVDGERITACRTELAECQRLAGKAARGGSDAIRPHSLTHSCRAVRGEHPGDALAGRDRWRPSQKPGSWVSSGACLLPGPGDTDGNYLADLEGLGELRRGQKASEVVARLGEPGPKSTDWDSLPSWFVQTWPYPVLQFAGPRESGPWHLDRIDAGPRCQFRTTRGIGVGSTRSEVLAVYAKDLRGYEYEEPEVTWEELARAAAEAPAGTAIFVGYFMYGGIEFRFDVETDRVVGITIRGPIC